MSWATEKVEAKLEEAYTKIESLEATIERQKKEIARLKGAKLTDPCRVCLVAPGSEHAGWCPRKGD